MDTTDGAKCSGFFKIDGRELLGDITTYRDKTNLYVHDREFFRPDNIENGCIHGVLHNRERVTLLHCVASPISGQAWVGGERYEYADIFPHYLVFGRRHIPPNEAVIKKIRLVTDDLPAIFYDFDAFGHALDPKADIQNILKRQSEKANRIIAAGDNPQITYFTGRIEIFSCDTDLGHISARHNPISNWGGPRGVYIKNQISLDVEYPEPVIFDDVLRDLDRLSRFLELVAGRRQNVENLLLQVLDGEAGWLEVYHSNQVERRAIPDEIAPQPSDLPIFGARQPQVFGEVLRNWLGRDESWFDARSRFSSSFSKRNYYDLDRIIASANMFDILPSSALPSEVDLSSEMATLRDKSRKLFKELPASTERDSVLAALGRVGQPSLRHKILHRANFILEKIPTKLPELSFVVDLAVDCRNHYVHGSIPKIEYSKSFFECVPFLTNALEFIFAASDLVQAGWDIDAWSRQGTTMSHPFARFLWNYDQGCEDLKQLVAR